MKNITELTSSINVFIHVPKTSGSTINKYYERSKFTGESHCEAWIDNDKDVSEKVLYLEWLSGHVPFLEMRKRLCEHTSRDLRFFSCIRNPLEQLMSHYNWLIEIYNRGGHFYDGHPTVIKEISHAIRTTDNSQPENVIQQIKASPGLFLNQQSRFILGENPHALSDQGYKEALKVYEFIATETTLPKLINQLSGLPYDDEKRENVSAYHFDKAVFKSDIMQEFLNEQNAADLRLYTFIKNQEQ